MRALRADGRGDDAPVRASEEKTLRAVMCDELKQLSGVTSVTSSGSANVMSTHYRSSLVSICVFPYRDQGGSPGKLTLYRAAPWSAVSMI